MNGPAMLPNVQQSMRLLESHNLVNSLHCSLFPGEISLPSTNLPADPLHLEQESNFLPAPIIPHGREKNETV